MARLRDVLADGGLISDVPDHRFDYWPDLAEQSVVYGMAMKTPASPDTARLAETETASQRAGTTAGFLPTGHKRT
jgi:hypothetical protein